ncbi:single-stranded DNA-binding protein [Flavivirga jejuensis]|uniref:Single-stranded DNA-binding protein n=1 Tax=Flavivirga jejuensis TaxID=870487 RepID=A0ABT8WUS5_9FLAO|nr:single-stranded DNA-binding protein [Flavivirga jejuensis]MDO5976940.1 single-stranded DNA-binding protein [Flavivirga jejuensis]
MSNLRNKVQLIGNVGDSPKITILESGHKVARFSMATNEYYRNAQGEKVQSTEWHYIVAWNKKADIIEKYTRKGKLIAIEGKLTSRSYVNDMNITCYVTEIVAYDILLLDSKETSTLTNEKLVEAETQQKNNSHTKEVEASEKSGTKKSQTRSRTRKNRKETNSKKA